ncbi:MAG: xanthine dehydrogenase family protein molybdopterin-binding subunit [Spirochaetia bacterium]|nr:xanthine dehydrogenase family protein molybdopterin-binding subunit [Spirochaetia bacterium]MCF7946883.1 xanthine dehydrogenase family protein molybdopterin-binding subunit [Spirochaetia bacterium]MCF7953190.1 xanthine dehydrogenase family protein molybdopterin-binding subunit [Spirochaetales bacterium]
MTKNISDSVRRVDAVEKAGGYAEYLSDLSFEGLLYGRLVRAEINRGYIKQIHLPDLPPEYFFISKDDIPEGGINSIHMIKMDWPVFVDREILFYGQTIGMVVGPDKAEILDIINGISIEYEETEAAFTIEEGLSLKGGPIHEENNIYADYHLDKGDVDTAFASAERILQDEIETGFQEHIYMEPQGMVGYIENGKPAITASCQCPFYLRKAGAPAINRKPEDIIVRQAITGGAFGGKEHFPDVIAAPLLVALEKIRKPIQIVFDRKEDISFTPKRHPSKVYFKTAIDDNGNILGMDIDAAINAGAFESCSPIVLQRVIFSLNSVYDIPNVRIHGRAVATNTFPSDAFRGFGAPQGIFAGEMHMSHAAMEMGLDEVDLKRKYFIKQWGNTVTNGKIHGTVKLPEMWEKIAEDSEYYRKNANFGRGNLSAVGTAFYLHGGGFTGNGEQAIINAHVKLRKTADNKVEILLSNVEMGQGLQTTFRKIAAQVLDLPYEDVIYDNPDTSKVPDSGPTVASRSIVVVGKLVERAAEKLKKIWNIDGEQEAEVVYKHPEGYAWDQETMQGDAYPSYSWGICAVEVEVDPITYEVETKNIWAIHDIGKAIDETIVQGQVNGGVIQALGYGSLEKLELKNGRFYQNTLADYMIPTTMDFPAMKSDLVENPYEYGPFGAKGLGELVFDGAAAAYADAVEKAIGKQVKKIPVTPEYIMELMRHE